MLQVIAYDIADPKRLHKVAKCCELYGGRIEKSVFELELDEQDFQKFWTEVKQILNLKEDAMIAYKVCASCEKGIQTLGKAKRTKPERCIFVG